MEKKTKMSNKTFKRIWITSLSIVLVLSVALNIAINIFESYVNNYLGYGTYEIIENPNTSSWDSRYYKLDYDNNNGALDAALAMSERVEAEGIVLLKNNGVLPLQSGISITMLGRDAADPIYGGSGSGSVDVSIAVTARQGLENADFKINQTVYDILSSYTSSNAKANIVMDDPDASSYYIGEMPISGYTNNAVTSFIQYNDAAVVFIGRGGGEGGDLTKDMQGWDNNYSQGQHQLELNKDEKDVIMLAKQHFDKVVVIINSSNAMELGELENDPGVDAILWVGSPGQVGFNAVGQVLNGRINPSGRLVDIYPADFTKDPTFVNFGDYAYSNIKDSFFVQYEEGIYYGYRYYETAAAEGFINYNEAVVYPFGHGLSYTTFNWTITNQRLDDVDGDIEIDVTVTNTGRVAGKDVVQLYYSAPYTRGGIEKSHVVLGAIAKTKMLNPGESETVMLKMAVEDMSSYDYKNAKSYVLEKGVYQLLIQNDSHNLKEGISAISYDISATITYKDGRSSDKIPVTNQFDDVNVLFTDRKRDGYITNFSRTDFDGTFPTAPTVADMLADITIIDGFVSYNAIAVNEESDANMPSTEILSGLSLIDLRGLDYHDPLWEVFLDQLTIDEMLTVTLNGAYHTETLKSIGKPATTELDGPAGFTSFMGNINCTSYPSSVVMASTFNVELIYELGVVLGNEALANKINGWYAPAMNNHRSPFGGRNFEYYSEDPVLSGLIGKNCVSGLASKGVYAFIKHYAVNDQETNRVNNGVAAWVNEQVLREIYLRPFEITIKNASSEMHYFSDEDGTVSKKNIGATAVMSSFNRIGTVWAGGSYPLMTTVLRNEWGFEGCVITDFNLYDFMVPDQGVYAGSDLTLTFTPMKTMQDSTSAAAVTNMRNAMHNILYTTTNSSAMNGLVSGSQIIRHTPTWRYVQIGMNIAIGLLLIAGAYWVIVRTRRNKDEVKNV